MTNTVELNGKKIQRVTDRTMLSILSESVGCYYCERTFIPPQVKEFTGSDEPLCPYCGIDSVVRTTDADELKGLFDKYFGPPYEKLADDEIS